MPDAESELTATIDIAPVAELHELRAEVYERSAMQILRSGNGGERPNWTPLRHCPNKPLIVSLVLKLEATMELIGGHNVAD
jgi:hypothetical protein